MAGAQLSHNVPSDLATRPTITATAHSLTLENRTAAATLKPGRKSSKDASLVSKDRALSASTMGFEAASTRPGDAADTSRYIPTPLRQQYTATQAPPTIGGRAPPQAATNNLHPHYRSSLSKTVLYVNQARNLPHSQLQRSASQPVLHGGPAVLRTPGIPIHIPPTRLDSSQGPQRILLSLASGITNEVEWALRVLLRLSTFPSDFVVSTVPGLVDEISDFVRETLGPMCHKGDGNEKSFSEFYDVPVAEIERGTAVMQTIYNLTLQSIENSRALGSNAELLDTILMLGRSCQNYDIQLLATETLEHISGARYIVSSPEDPLLKFAERSSSFLSETVHDEVSPDRALLLPALRIYTFLLGLEMNHKILIPHLTARGEFWFMLFNYLMLLGDTVLLSTILDFVYQYTLVDATPILAVAATRNLNPVKLVFRLLKLQLPPPFGSYEKWMNLGHVNDTAKGMVQQAGEFVQHQADVPGTSRYDIQGIPLTAVLTLRNLTKSRDPRVKELFLPLLNDIVVLTATYPSMSYWLNLVLSELGTDS